MKRFISLKESHLFLLTVIWTLNSCSFFRKDPVVLQFNSQQWTSRQFAKRLAGKIQTSNIKNTQNQILIENLKEQLITDLLMEYLIHEWAKNHSITVSKTEWQQEIKKLKNLYPNDIVFKSYLKRKNTNEEQWKKQIRKNLLSKKVIQKIGAQAKNPEPRQMQEYYKNNPDLFKKKERILIHHIFHKKKDLMTKVQVHLKQKKNLISAARLFVDNSQITQSQWIEKGVLKIFDQAFSLKINEISPIWTSPYGFHMIQLLDKKPPQKMTFEAAKTHIQKTLLIKRQKALFSKWLDQQGKRINILKNDKAIKKIKVKKI